MRYLIVLFLTIFGAVGAGEINFTAEVDRTAVGLGEPLRLTVRVEGTNISRVPKPELPKLDGFDNLGSSQSQSTEIAIVNGRVTQRQTISFVYTLVPKRTGELVIGSCRLNYGGVEYTTEPITVQVTKSSTGQPSQPAPRARQRTSPSPFDLFEEPGEASGECFLVASADRPAVYQGEEVTVTWTFYTSGDVANLNIKEAPSLTGFWAQDVYQPRELRYERKQYQGRWFYAAVLRRTKLFPTSAGELTVGRMTVAGELVSPGFFFSTTRPFEVSSRPITIQVKPLPDAGKPASFTGGVGAFQVSAVLSADTSRGGEPLTLTLSVTGTGNLGLVAAPALPEITGIKVLAPEIKDNFKESGGRLTGTRRFDYPVLPMADGRFRIPEIEFGFFDPQTGGYYTKRTKALEFVAVGVPSRSGAEPVATTGMRMLGADIRHIKTDNRLTEELNFAGWWLFYPLGLVVVAAGLIAGCRRRRLQADPAYARRIRAGGQARRRLKEAERLLAQRRLAEFYSRLSQALTEYAGDRFNINTTAMTIPELREALLQAGAAGETVARLIEALNSCQLASFSPGMVQCEPRQLLQLARQVMMEL